MDVKDRLTAHNEVGQEIINMDGVKNEFEARERIRKYSSLIIARLTGYEDTGLSPDEVNSLKSENVVLRERLEKLGNDIGERIKTEFYCEFDELIPSIMADKIDEIVKEAAR